jgi:hypothetical protein
MSLCVCVCVCVRARVCDCFIALVTRQANRIFYYQNLIYTAAEAWSQILSFFFEKISKKFLNTQIS